MLKKVVAVLLLIVISSMFCSCNVGNKMTADEEMLYNALLVASDSFYNPSEVRILAIGNSTVMPTMLAYYECIVVRILGENQGGGTASAYYLLYLCKVEGKELATKMAEMKALANWNDCEDDDYLKSSYSTFEKYKEFVVGNYLENYFFHSEYEKAQFLKNSAMELWNDAAYNEYPKSIYDSFEEYLRIYTSLREDDYFVVMNYDKEIPSSRDEYFGRLMLLEDVHISTDELTEEKYSVSKINNALNDYWADRLGYSN